MNLGQSLLRLVNQEVGPVRKLVRNLFQCSGVVLRQLDLLPQVCWSMCALNSFDIEVADTYGFTDALFSSVHPNPRQRQPIEQAVTSHRTLTILLQHGRVSAVGEWARAAIAQARDIVLVLAEIRLVASGAAMQPRQLPGHQLHK